MGLIKEGIEQVRAHALPAGIWPGGECFGTPRVAMVKWSVREPLSDMLYQVYVDGCYSGTTFDGEQRQMVVPVPGSAGCAVRIEVFGVCAAEGSVDFSGQVAGSQVGGGRVRIVLLRCQSLGPGSVCDIYYDNGTGQIDYETALNEEPVKVWAARGDKSGFGMGLFGDGDFGYEGGAAVGFGRGCFGAGEFGFDADTIEWVSSELPAGVYRFCVKVTDGPGCQGESVEVGPVTVTPAAKPVEGLEICSFDASSNQLVLEII